MGLYKLREWVGTVTGKGDRWGRDRLGRSAPAFMAASTPALPHPPALHVERQAVKSSAAVVLAARPANCGPFVCCEACAGQRIRWLCLPAVVCSAGCVPACLCLPCPLPSSTFLPHSSLLCPVQVLLCLPLFLPCAPGSPLSRAGGLFLSQGQQFASCKTVPLAAATRACRGGPCIGFVDSYLFPAESMILGHGGSVEFLRLRCLCKCVCIPQHVLC